MSKILMLPAAGALLLGLAACNPYNPVDRTLGGAAIGAGTGAAIGAGVGAVAGAASTPPPPPPPPPYYC
jgi:hypothetical protein